MICKSCGSQMNDDAVVCESCGQKVEASEAKKETLREKLSLPALLAFEIAFIAMFGVYVCYRLGYIF